MRLAEKPAEFLRGFIEDVDALKARAEKLFKGQNRHVDINTVAYRQLQGSLQDAKAFIRMGLNVETNLEKTR